MEEEEEEVKDWKAENRMNGSGKGKDADYRRRFRSLDMRMCGENDAGLRFVDTLSTEGEPVINPSHQIIRDTEGCLAEL